MHKPPTVWASKFMSKYRRDPTREIQVMHPYYLQFLSGVNERRRKFTISSDSGFNVARSYNNGGWSLCKQEKIVENTTRIQGGKQTQGTKRGHEWAWL